MQLKLRSGKYVVAVSGGVDSVTLLDLLSKNIPKLDLIAAHYDHGIRKDSIRDRKLVERLARKYGLPFIYAEGKLGPDTSEDEARNKRYAFLWQIVKENKADGLITAHHEDDLIETAVINIIRGTGRRGLSSIINPKIYRPMLNYSKKEILAYAKSNKLTWNEDATNQDTKYLRNYVRLKIMPKLSDKDRHKITAQIKKQSALNKSIDANLKALTASVFEQNKLPRLWFASLDNKTASEVLAYWLRNNGLREYDKKNLARLVVSLKTAKENRKIDVFSGWLIDVNKGFLALRHEER